MDANPAVDANPIALALAGLGAALTIIGVFLPWVEATQFTRVAQNTLIQSGDGWVFIVLGIGVLIAAYTAYSRRRRNYVVLILGVIAVGVAIYEGTGDRLQLHPVNPSARSVFGLNSTEQGSPGVGIYMVGAGGAVAAFGGLGLAGFGAASRATGRKRRPECAEWIQGQATVCRYCGHQFQ